MAINTSNIRKHIQNLTFDDLFIDELGWDNYQDSINLLIEDTAYELNIFAQKRGMVVSTCNTIPDRNLRIKIEKQVAKSYRENIIIYVDDDQTDQVWQWVKHETGKPLANRERRFSNGQSGENIAQILTGIAFSLDEEDNLSIVDVTSRVRAAFDVEKVTKRFYDKFKKQHDAFLNFIDGIPDDDLQRWYASVMINRLMFIYFVQKKSLLDNDINYLVNKLNAFEGNYYRDFLCPLFFEGLAKKENQRSPEMNQLLGKVPYLNGGLFLKHTIEEQHGEAINIPNEAFEKLFNFFDGYRWHLDERPLRDDNEINPDVLGYIFEKYINQKQMGAYYTKEDITEYISKNTVIPYLFDEARKAVKIAFEGEHTVWDLLAENPDRYIYSAVRHGTELDLPENIAIGVDDVSQRGDWNTPAPSEFGLPTEIWRETVARRQRYFDIRKQMENDGVKQINDLITLNLDIQQFAQDVIDYSDSSDLIRAFWKAINGVTVLDPTCGSGAFLFAALNILEPLYDACLERMADLVDDLPDDAHPQKLSDFKSALERMNQHPNRRYFILKSIIVNNLFGVDIMEEAVEICKLRLFLKLVAQIDDKRRIEPLPDIDFNIRAGNTLVGFATQEQLKQAMTKTSDGQIRMLFPEEQEALDTITQKAEAVDRLFGLFRQQQTELGGEVLPEDKANLRTKLEELADELNHLLAVAYGINPKKEKDYKKWLKSHTPFHWFTEFYGVIKDGGFDVIIGNPPYVEYSQIRKQYRLLDIDSDYMTNLYSACCNLSNKIKNTHGYAGFIVPVSFPSTDRMQPLRDSVLKVGSVYHVSFDVRPSKLFAGAEQRLTIFLQVPSIEQQIYACGYLKWYKDERSNLFNSRVYYSNSSSNPNRNNLWYKVSGSMYQSIINKLQNHRTLEESGYLIGDQTLFYKNTGLRYFNTVTLAPPRCWINGEPASSSRETELTASPQFVHGIHSLLVSSLFFMYYQANTNCRDLNPSDIKRFPVIKGLDSDILKELSQKLEIDSRQKSKMIRRNQKQTGLVEIESFSFSKSKDLLDEIDRVLAQHYGFTDEELDFIINYDIKYRMGNALFEGKGGEE